ncbi:hypothetical protein [Arthrobacter agilis]|uniref:hypothetical protein n=1 Tax=Arthrobacter agilis TaxID=37921 RepID=UPI001ABF27E8|nr:hypothetical protein [Arthrobacter agilis]
MVAVVAAFWFWIVDRDAVTERQMTSLSHSAAREIVVLNQKLRGATIGQIYDDQGWHPQRLKADVDRQVLDLIEQCEVQLSWLHDARLEKDLRKAFDFLDTDGMFAAYIQPWRPYERRVREITSWVDRKLQQHVSSVRSDPGALPHYAAYADAWETVSDEREQNYADQERYELFARAEDFARDKGRVLPPLPKNAPTVHLNQKADRSVVKLGRARWRRGRWSPASH